MNEVLVLPYAVAVALSPMPIAALVLMLLSDKAKINSVSFMFGWIVGLAGLLIAAIFFLGNVSALTGGSRTMYFIHLVLGVFLIGLAIKEWKMRPSGNEEVKMPGWMNVIEGLSPIKSFGIALGLAVINFKNLPLGVAAASELSKSTSDTVSGIFIYLLIASSTIVIPTVAFLLLGDKLKIQLEGLKNWLIYHNFAILFVIFLILGSALIAKGISAI